MICPRCMQNSGQNVNNSHYVCNRPECTDLNNKRTQFKFITDTKLYFPYNVIFPQRSIKEFYRKPYLIINEK